MPLLFTNEQQGYINNARDAFNRNEQQLAALHGNNQLIGNASPLPKYAWETIDRQVTPVQRSILAVFDSLSASYSKAVPIGPMVHYFTQVNDSTNSATVTLDGRNNGKADTSVYTYQGTPLPIITDRAAYGWRQVAAAQQAGFGSFTQDGIDNSVRVVSEKAENLMLYGDANVVVGGSTLYGLLNHPKRNTDTHGLDLNGATGANWLAALNKGKAKLHGDNFYGKVKLYLNYGDWYYANTTDYIGTYPKSIIQRLMETGVISEIVPCSKVPANSMVFLADQMGVVNVLNGMPLATTPEVRQKATDDYVFTTMMATALEIRYDSKDNCGIAVVTKA